MVRLFATCGTNLEPLLTEELSEMGFTKTSTGFRGVYIEVDDIRSVYKINYLSRIATRVLYPLHSFKVWDAKGLYKSASEIDWSRYLKLHETFAIDFSVNHPAFKNSLFAAQVVKDALCDHFRDKVGARPSVNTANPRVQFHLFIHAGWATISLDTSGAPLHKRGYRGEGGEAPLQENLAAALLKIARYTKDDVLVDPCMGSGTFLIEAAYMATNTPPGILRQKWGFFSLPDYDEASWLAVKEEADKAIIPLEPKKLYGIDLSKTQVRYAMANLRLSNLHKGVSIADGDFRTWNPPVKPTLLMANPPYGKRMGGEDYLDKLYYELGDFYKKQAPARGFVLTTPDRSIGLKPSKRHVIYNGGIEGRLLEYDLYQAENV